MPDTELFPRSNAASGAGAVVLGPGHPAIMRISDVLRSRASKPRTLLLDDPDSIEQAIIAGVRVESIYATSKHAHEAQRLQARAPGADQFALAEDTMRSILPRDNAPRVLALARAPRPAGWRDLLATQGDVIVLDGVRITGNIGAIVRSARALGAAGMVLVDSELSSVFDRRLVRASRGLVFALPTLLAERDDLVSFLRFENLPLLGLSGTAATPLEHIRHWEGRAAIVMGSERYGASAALDAVTTERYAIPMAAGVESLNVSVAAALALYERRRLVGLRS